MYELWLDYNDEFLEETEDTFNIPEPNPDVLVNNRWVLVSDDNLNALARQRILKALVVNRTSSVPFCGRTRK